MTISQQDCLKGHFLMAMPGLMDPNFHRTVTIICEHNSQGAMGAIINRPHSELTGEQIFKELDVAYLPEIASIPLHYGGPVHANEIFVIHGPPFNWDGCLVVSPSFALSNTMDIIKAIAMGRGPKQYIITIGCSGWGAGQLESEMGENAWLNCLATGQIAFEITSEQRWETAIKTLGINPDLLSADAGHA